MVYRNLDELPISLISKFLYIAGLGSESDLLFVASGVIDYLDEKGYAIIPKEEVYY